MAVLKQNQFEFDDETVLNTVLMGHKKMWEVMHRKDAIYVNPDATEDDYMKAGELEAEFGEMGGYTAESDAGTLLEWPGCNGRIPPKPDERHSRQPESAGIAGTGIIWQPRYTVAG